IAQLEMAGDEVGVQVREEHVRDLQAVLVCEGEISIDVTLRIDDRRDPRLFVADEIRSVCQAVQIELMKNHVSVAAALPQPAPIAGAGRLESAHQGKVYPR